MHVDLLVMSKKGTNHYLHSLITEIADHNDFFLTLVYTLRAQLLISQKLDFGNIIIK